MLWPGPLAAKRLKIFLIFPGCYVGTGMWLLSQLWNPGSISVISISFPENYSLWFLVRHYGAHAMAYIRMRLIWLGARDQ